MKYAHFYSAEYYVCFSLFFLELETWLFPILGYFF